MAELLKTLKLRPPARGLPGGPVAAPPKIDLFPQDVIRRVAAGEPDDAQLKAALKALPADPAKRVDALADLVLKLGDSVRRDPVVKALRDAAAKLQPLLPEQDAKKKIDAAIDGVIEKGLKSALEALLKAIVGKGPTKVDRDAPPRHGPNVKERDLGEKILKTPEIPLPFDQPKKVRRNFFEFRGLPKRTKVSKYFDFRVLTPDSFEPYGKLGAARVVLASKADYDANGGRPRHLRDKRIEDRGEVKMSLAAPDEPGACVVFIFWGTGPESHPVETIEVEP